jgi:Protein phosphatase 2C
MTKASFIWASAEAVGAHHRQKSEPSQDRLGVSVLNGPGGEPWIIAAVADGAGSTEHGGIGAGIAVATFIASVTASITAGETSDLDAVLRAAVTRTRTEIARVADEQGHTLRDYATTFSAMVGNRHAAGYIQIGDGVMVAGPDWHVIIPPQNGEHADETVFITCPDWLAWLQTKIVPTPPATIVLMTDGFRDLVVKPFCLTPNVPFFTSEETSLADGATDVSSFHKGFSEQLTAFVSSDGVRTRTDDDISLVAISIRTGD